MKSVKWFNFFRKDGSEDVLGAVVTAPDSPPGPGPELPPPPRLQPEPLAPHIPILSDDERAEYARLANKLGTHVRGPALEGELAQALRELMIPVYDRAKVEGYLDEHGYWGWFPLSVVQPRAIIHRVNNVSHRPSYYYGGMATNDPDYGVPNAAYAEAVPLPALLTAERILDRLPSTLFYIAAARSFPDPFLAAVDGVTGETFVIERWDEPGFRS